ncbi:MAG: Rrf2 family transcriptional regulator [Burkholderiales bacterium]|nr:Rrf2 family transcriptional regulator [Phycisphaerae bacterium]
MIFTTPTEYAIRGMAELCGRGGADRPVMLDDLVIGTTLPRDFLAKVFQRLVKSGLLKSAKGRGGGFMLAKPANLISLEEIINAIDGPIHVDSCVVGLAKCNDAQPCPQHDLYRPVRERLKEYLKTTTVTDLAESLKTKQAWVRIVGAKTIEKSKVTNGAY